MSTYDKYMTIYKEKKRAVSQDRNLTAQSFKGSLTDRNTYLTFLELQLDRVSQACLQAEGFADRIE